jgi:Ca-activated chloride channel family protein
MRLRAPAIAWPLALTLLAAAAVVKTGAQSARIIRDPQRLRSNVEVDVVTATVRDQDGRLVTGLSKEAFEVYEDAVPQPITQFTNERVPIGLGLLLDISDSMFGPRMRDARMAVTQFLTDLIAPTDSYFVMTFNHAPRLVVPWTSDVAGVQGALEAIKPSGGTSIYDTVIRALPVVSARSPERGAIVLISDGADTASDATLRDVRSALLRTDAFVFAVAIDSPVRQAINTRVNPTALGELTGQSGGHTEVVRDTAELPAAAARIAEELNSQYLLGYATPHPGDGKFHSIRVRVTLAGHRVRARAGYVAEQVK